MNIQMQGSLNLGIGRNLLLSGNGMKSTRDRLERQNERDSQIAFFENQKARLKEIESGDLEGIGRKLELLHSYEDQIAAVKLAYNQEQMKHVMDEAMERAEQIGEAAEKLEPKTAEERKKELAEEALGIDETKGELTEKLEELTEDVTGKLSEAADELTEEMNELPEDMEELPGELPEDPDGTTAPDTETPSAIPGAPEFYEKLDIYI